MRQLLSCALVVIVASSVAGCTRSVASSERRERSGDFRVLIPARPSSLNPDLNFDETSLFVGRSLFNHLLTLNESGRLLPELAASWTVSPDGRTYTFHLRPGVRWHDGMTFSSADVEWTLETLKTEGYGGKDALAPVEEISAPDASTVVIRLRHPWAPFATDLSGMGLAILPRHVYAGSDWRTNSANDRPIGTGPFKFGRWVDENTLQLDANTDYFRSGPYVERITFEVAPVETVDERLKSGTVDYSLMRPASVDLKAPPDPLVAHTLPTSGRYYLALNLNRRPFGDVRVRRALAMALDRLEIITQGLAGLGAPALGYYTPDVEWAYNSAARVPEYDPQRAAQLLDEAGLRLVNGVRFRAAIVAPNARPMRDVVVVIRNQLAAIGVQLDVEYVSMLDWPRRTVVDHNFDMTIVAGQQGPDPDQLRRRFLATTDSGAYIGYDDPEFREAVERGAKVVSVEERSAAYHRAQEILARDVPFIPLVEGVRVVMHHRRVSGLPQLEARGLVGAFDFSLVKLGATRAATSR